MYLFNMVLSRATEYMLPSSSLGENVIFSAGERTRTENQQRLKPLYCNAKRFILNVERRPVRAIMTHKVQNSSNSRYTPSTATDERSSLLVEPVVDRVLAWISSTSRIACSAKSVNALHTYAPRCWKQLGVARSIPFFLRLTFWVRTRTDERRNNTVGTATALTIATTAARNLWLTPA